MIYRTFTSAIRTLRVGQLVIAMGSPLGCNHRFDRCRQWVKGACARWPIDRQYHPACSPRQRIPVPWWIRVEMLSSAWLSQRYPGIAISLRVPSNTVPRWQRKSWNMVGFDGVNWGSFAHRSFVTSLSIRSSLQQVVDVDRGHCISQRNSRGRPDRLDQRDRIVESIDDLHRFLTRSRSTRSSRSKRPRRTSAQSAADNEPPMALVSRDASAPTVGGAY